MSWVTVGVAAVGMVKGIADGNANRKRQKQLDAHRKAQIAYSPWTGLGDPGPVNAGPQGADAALGGAMQGAMLGQSFKGLDFSGGAAPTGNSAMVDPAMTKAAPMGAQAAPKMVAQGSAGSMGSSWGGLQSQPMNMDPTKDMYSNYGKMFG